MNGVHGRIPGRQWSRAIASVHTSCMTTPLTLDPPDWNVYRSLLHRAVDDALDHLAALRQGPAWQPMPAISRDAVRRPLPAEGIGPEALFEEVRRHIAPYAWGNTHPRSWGWVNGNGSAAGLLADVIAAGMNTNVPLGNQSAAVVEEQVIAWSRQIMGFPAEATGLLVTGASIANLVGLTVARDTMAGTDLPAAGTGSLPPLTVYASSETHSSIDKAMAILGLGTRQLRKIPVDQALRLDVRKLHEAIRADRAQGLRPICVVGNAGTVNNGGIDDLGALADVCAAERLWFHVDGAFGAVAMLAPGRRPQLAGLERADSLAFDFHKWLHVPYEAGCILVRDGAAHRRASFAPTRSYLVPLERGASAGPDFSQLGPELSRAFRGLKVWMTLLAHGTTRLGELVEQNCQQAAWLAERLTQVAHCVVPAPVALNIVPFRLELSRLPGDRRDAINRELLMRLQERGIAIPSGTSIGGRFTLRAAITNHRTRQDDLEALAVAVEQLGAELLSD